MLSQFWGCAIQPHSFSKPEVFAILIFPPLMILIGSTLLTTLSSREHCKVLPSIAACSFNLLNFCLCIEIADTYRKAIQCSSPRHAFNFPPSMFSHPCVGFVPSMSSDLHLNISAVSSNFCDHNLWDKSYPCVVNCLTCWISVFSILVTFPCRLLAF